MRTFGLVCITAFALGLAACSGHAQSDSTAAASPSADAVAGAPVATASAAPAATVAPFAGASGAPATGAVAMPTADPNLLSTANGTIVRNYSPATLDGMNDGNLRNAAYGIGTELPATAKPPYVFTFELAGLATITGFQAALRSAQPNGPAPSVTFAVSTTGADRGFSDAGTISGSSPLPANTQARWVRVTANQLFDSVGATGTLAPPPAGLNPTGIYVQDADADKDGTFQMLGKSGSGNRARFVAVGSSLVATQCTTNELIGTYLGHLHGRTWTAVFPGNKDANADTISAAFNDDGSIIAGTNQFGKSTFFTRTSEQPKFCEPRATGAGAHHVLVLDQDPVEQFYPADSPSPLPGYAFEAIGAGMLDAAALNGKEAVITREACKIPELMSLEQQNLLLQWAAAGHKLLLGGGDCGGGSDFTWLPYPFTAAGPGPETTHASLIQIESNALGTNDKNDLPHFVDVDTYVKDENNGLANAVAVTTTDPHWCGHFFVAKTTNVNGFVQTYAVNGRGVMIYDGFNVGDAGRPALQRIRQLELALPVPASLACTQKVTEAFLLEPNQEAAFVAGTAQTLHVPMDVLANQGFSGPVTIKTSGDLAATVTPNGFSLSGGTQHLGVAVTIPAATKAGVYTIDVLADNGAGKTAHASATLTGSAPLKKAFAPTQKRIRIYGIHFDVDSAVIQARSEPVIAEIADLLKANPSWRFQVEGHTDSDGGAAYNLALSQRRAQAVVDDLVAHHGIARGRLMAKGYGLTKPVASNATDGGKALNRRVELLRL
jgi:outer membrane protein OmpA-like peptidoglycan-associated protein